MTLADLQAIFPDATDKTWHLHPNGGGWVANSATVEDTAYIGSSAQVSGNARVSGDAQVSGDARVYGDAWVSSPLYIQPSAHPISVSSRTEVSIGCKRHSIEWWLEHYAEVGAENGYTAAQIAEYGALLQAVAAWMAAL